MADGDGDGGDMMVGVMSPECLLPVPVWRMGERHWVSVRDLTSDPGDPGDSKVRHQAQS
jgi:hypothetical protein